MGASGLGRLLLRGLLLRRLGLRLRLGLGLRLGRGGLGGCLVVGGAGVAGADHRQLGADLDGLVLLDLDLQQGARDGRGDLGVDLVGGDLEQRLVHGDLVADRLQPAGDGALGDGLAERGERDGRAAASALAALGRLGLGLGVAGGRSGLLRGRSLVGLGSRRVGLGLGLALVVLLVGGLLPLRPEPPAADCSSCSSSEGAASWPLSPESEPPDSPSSPTVHSSAPTSTVSSSWTLISSRVPATGEGISVSTLSVETSSRGSSTATWSPGCFNQRVTVPSVTDSPSAGRVTEVAIAFLRS